MSNDQPRPMILKRDVVAYGTGFDADKSRTFEAGATVSVFAVEGMPEAWLCKYADRVFYEAHIPHEDLVAA